MHSFLVCFFFLFSAILMLDSHDLDLNSLWLGLLYMLFDVTVNILVMNMMAHRCAC